MAGRGVFHKPFKVASPDRRTYKGVVYGSLAEAKRAAELDLFLRAGRIVWWLRQVPVDVGEPGVDMPYRVDFLVGEIVGQWQTGLPVVEVHAEEVKGCDTPPFRRHVKQWLKRGPMPLHVIRGKKIEIIPKGVDYGREECDEGGGETQAQGGANYAAGAAGERPAADDHGAGGRGARRVRPQAAADDRGEAVPTVEKPGGDGPPVDRRRRK